jgi:hypothetical protein
MPGDLYHFKILMENFTTEEVDEPIRVAILPEVRTIFKRSNIWIIGSNPTRVIDVCPRLFAFVLFCIGRGHAMGQISSTFVFLLKLIYIFTLVCNIFVLVEVLTFYLTPPQALLIPIL